LCKSAESRFICLAAVSTSISGLEDGFVRESVLTESFASPEPDDPLLHDVKPKTTANNNTYSFILKIYTRVNGICDDLVNGCS